MPVVPCPQCRRRLNLPAGLAGSLVACPACGHTFTAAGLAVPPTELTTDRLVLPTGPPVRAEPPARLDAVAPWLQAAFGLQLVLALSWCTCFGPVAQSFWPAGFEVVYLALPIAGFVAPWFVLAGIRALLSQSSYPTALGGLVVLLGMGGVACLQAVGVGVLHRFGLLDRSIDAYYPGPTFSVCVLTLPGVAGFISVVAAVRGLLILHRPDVLAGFPTEAGR